MFWNETDFLMFGGGYNIWRGFSEKSANAQSREESVTSKFDGIRSKLENALIANKFHVVELGRKADSHSLFQCLPDVTVQHIFDYVEKKPSSYRPLGAVTPKKKANGAAKKKPNNQNQEEGKDDVLNHALDIVSLYTPGKKHVIHISNPDLHLTGPCWRDFSRHVRSFANWDVKRTAATPAEKAKWSGCHRKGKVYFIHVAYTVPGAPIKKKTTKKRASNAASTNEAAAAVAGQATDVDSKPPAKKKSKSGVTLNPTEAESGAAFNKMEAENGVSFNKTVALQASGTEDSKPPAKQNTKSGETTPADSSLGEPLDI